MRCVKIICFFFLFYLNAVLFLFKYKNLVTTRFIFVILEANLLPYYLRLQMFLIHLAYNGFNFNWMLQQ